MDGLNEMTGRMTGNSGRDRVLSFLDGHAIPYRLYTHPPLPTIEEALRYWKDLDSVHCKNLFFRNHQGNRHYLAVFECHKDLDIHSLEHRLRQGKHPKELFDNGHRVKLFLDKDLKTAERLSFHPCDNTASVVIDNDGFMRFLGIWGGEYEWIAADEVQDKD